MLQLFSNGKLSATVARQVGINLKNTHTNTEGEGERERWREREAAAKLFVAVWVI